MVTKSRHLLRRVARWTLGVVLLTIGVVGCVASAVLAITIVLAPLALLMFLGCCTIGALGLHLLFPDVR